MIKQEITFKDFEDNERRMTAYFHLSKVEVLNLEFDKAGSLSNAIKRIQESADPSEILVIVQDVIAKSYGVKSDDGLRFMKTDEVTGRPLFEKFKETDAYSELYMSLTTDATKCIEFFNGIIPKELLKQVEAQISADSSKVVKI